jgi:hypothetical protein
MPTFGNIPMRPRTGFVDVDNGGADPEDSIYMGPNADLRAARKSAISSVLGDDLHPASSDPSRATETVDLGGTDLLGNPNTPVKWQGGRNFAQQIDPKIRQQIVNEVMGDDTLAPKPITATFGGKNFTMTPGRTISQNAANAINARQMRQMEIDRQLASEERRQKYGLEAAALPGKQLIERDTLKHGWDTEQYNREHPAELRTALTAAEIAKANRAKTDQEYAAAHGGMTPEEERTTHASTAAALMAAAANDPNARTTIPGLVADIPGYNSPGAQATVAALSQQKPVAAADVGDVRNRALNSAGRFGEQDTATIGWDPTEQDVTSLIQQRDELAKAIAVSKPGITPQQAHAEATAELDDKLANYSNHLNAGWVKAARQRLQSTGPSKDIPSYGAQVVGANPLLPRRPGSGQAL